MTRSILAGALLLALGSLPANAQGNLSSQGFGYPTGQLSASALSVGGATAELDASSALNPANVAVWSGAVLFMQYEPEFRTVNTSGSSTRTMTARFPMVGVSVPFGRWVTAQVSASTFLDRTWSSSVTTQRDIGGTIVDATEVFSSDGGITDFRLALAYAPTRRFQVGLAGHVFSGENRIVIEQRFPDTVRFSGARQESDLSYGAYGLSAGAMLRLATHLGIGASVRVGGDMDAQTGDTVISTGKLPMRYGASVSYAGISGVALSARANFDEWSSMESMRGTGSRMRAFDSWDYGVGADISGPTIARRNIAVRIGARYRGLPFGAGTSATVDPSKVNELTLAGGFGIPLGIGRSQLDVGIARASRKAENAAVTGNASESAYILSFGVRVRP